LPKQEILLNHQSLDGSFGPEPVLRIPQSHIIHPNEITDWSIDTFPHTNTVYSDTNRLFTTATSYGALLNLMRSKW